MFESELCCDVPNLKLVYEAFGSIHHHSCGGDTGKVQKLFTVFRYSVVIFNSSKSKYAGMFFYYYDVNCLEWVAVHKDHIYFQ